MRLRFVVILFGFSLAALWSPNAHAQYAPDIFYCISSNYNSAADVIYLVNYLFRGGPAPEPVAFAANLDCAGGVNIIDVVYLVNYVYRGGPRPCGYCTWFRDPVDTRDAEVMALWMAREVSAPETLKARLQNDLLRLRTMTGAEQTALSSAHFDTPWILSRVGMEVDGFTFDLLERGEHHAWDSLNAVYELSDYDLESYNLGDQHRYFATLHFGRLLNSVLLAEIYKSLPGVLGAWREVWYSTGEHWLNNLFPRQHGDTMTYLFHMEWDCAGICRGQRFWYAAALPDTAWIIGDWNNRVEEAQPAWWPEARENIDWWYDHW